MKGGVDGGVLVALAAVPATQFATVAVFLVAAAGGDSRLPPLAAVARYAPRERIGGPPGPSGAVPAGRRALD